MTKHLDSHKAIGYRGPNHGENGREEGLTSLLMCGGRSAEALRVRRFFASALINPVDYFGGLHGGPPGPPAHTSGDVNPCGPSFFWACHKDCAHE